MELAFGADFEGVRLHTDSQADRLNSAINARAFTIGQDIFFAQGEYQPTNAFGCHLLAHELTHTLQQSGRIIRPVWGKKKVGSQGIIHKQGNHVFNKLVDIKSKLTHVLIHKFERHSDSKNNNASKLIDDLFQKLNVEEFNNIRDKLFTRDMKSETQDENSKNYGVNLDNFVKRFIILLDYIVHISSYGFEKDNNDEVIVESRNELCNMLNLILDSSIDQAAIDTRRKELTGTKDLNSFNQLLDTGKSILNGIKTDFPDRLKNFTKNISLQET
jgi:hypothetical protein